MYGWFLAPLVLQAVLVLLAGALAGSGRESAAALGSRESSARVELCSASEHSDHLASPHPIELPADAPLPADVVPIVERSGVPLEEYESLSIVSNTIFLRSESAEFPNRDPHSGALVLTRSISIQLFTNGWDYWWGETDSTVSYPCDAASAPSELEVTSWPDHMTSVTIGPAYIPGLPRPVPNQLHNLSELSVAGQSLHEVMTDVVGVLLPGCDRYAADFIDSARWLTGRAPTGLTPGAALPADLIEYASGWSRLPPAEADVIDIDADRVLMIWLPRDESDWQIEGLELVRAQRPTDDPPVVAWQVERFASVYGCMRVDYELPDAWRTAREDIARRKLG